MLMLHPIKHQCPHFVPSVVAPPLVLLLSFFSIMFSPLPPVECIVHIWHREGGQFFRVFSYGRQTADLFISSSAQLLFASSFTAWTWQDEDLSIATSSKSRAFSSNFWKISAVCLPVMRPISTHLCFLLFCLYVSPSL